MLTLPPRARYDEALLRKSKLIEGEALARPMLVCAPHPDDETLGCGGTIIKKLCAGAEVRVVFMTSGGNSHTGFMPAAEMVRLREEEAEKALDRLGVRESAVFLGFEDGRLNGRHNEAVTRMVSLIGAWKPEEIYIPYRLDVTQDHLATRRIVRNAVRLADGPRTICEYPVWYWHHWPKINLRLSLDRTSLRLIRDTLMCGFGMPAKRDFNTAVWIEDVLQKKRNALNAHRSQMERFQADPQWPILADVAGGSFLHSFFQPYEFFYRYPYPEG